MKTINYKRRTFMPEPTEEYELYDGSTRYYICKKKIILNGKGIGRFQINFIILVDVEVLDMVNAIFNTVYLMKFQYLFKIDKNYDGHFFN